MMQIGLIGIAAGAASALLFASFASRSLLSIPLFYLAPLPLLIAALGWSHIAGLIAAVVASAALALIFGEFFFLAFLLGVGLPAWWLGYLALLARPTADPDGLEWYPVGRIVVWASLIASAVVTMALLTIATDAESLREALRKLFEPLLRGDARVPLDTDAGRSARTILRPLVEYPDLILPPAAAVVTTIVTVFALWLAGKVVRISGRLRRPWPDIPEMTFPAFALPLLAGALAGAFVLPGLGGILSLVLATALLTACAMLGLAVLHGLTRHVTGRGLILGAVYGSIVVFSWPMLLLALLGVADIALDLRGRAARRRPPPPRLE